MANFIKFSQKRGPTVYNRKPFIRLTNQQIDEIQDEIVSTWEDLIFTSFSRQGGITQNYSVREWKPLSERYKRQKILADMSTDILEATKYPTLRERYIESIYFNRTGNGLGVQIIYPELYGGPRNYDRKYGSDLNKADAGVLQLETKHRRRLIISTFIQQAKYVLNEYLQDNFDEILEQPIREAGLSR